MTYTDWVALGVGGYAALVATAALVWNIVREKRNVTVRVRYAFGVGYLEGEEKVAIEIVNNGRHPINIQEIGFRLSGGTKLFNPTTPGSLGWLKDGDGTSHYIPRQEIEDMSRKAKERGKRIVAAYVRDSTGKHYRGKVSKRAAWFNE